jgi:DNA-binding MarR family transcriptional regulator
VTQEPDLSAIAARLIVYGSRFASAARRRAGVTRSSVSLRVLSNLQLLGPTRVGDLAHLERLTQPSMTSAVNRLEAEGLVAREPDETDARASLVRLTDAGEAELADFRRRAAEAVLPKLEQLDAEERETLLRASVLLERLTAPDARDS